MLMVPLNQPHHSFVNYIQFMECNTEMFSLLPNKTQQMYKRDCVVLIYRFLFSLMKMSTFENLNILYNLNEYILYLFANENVKTRITDDN